MARLILASLLAIVIAAAAPAGAGAVEVGTVPDMSWGTSATDQGRTASLMQEAGVQWARMNISWKSVEENGKGVINNGYLSEIDGAVDRVRAAGIDVVMPMGDNVPYWASSDPNKYVDSNGIRRWNVTYPPSDFQDYADAFRFVVNRYKAKGVHVFEIWNEPNHPDFWASGPDPVKYAQMLEAAYPAIKTADPGATVLGGALAANDYEFLQGIYDAGGGAYFDAVSTHSYPHGDPNACWNDSTGHRHSEALCAVENVRNTMVANGDSEKQIWLDEFGWSTCSNSYSSCWGKGTTEAEQAEYLIKAFQKLDGYPYVKAAFAYQFRNLYFGSESPGSWGDNLGLLRRDFSKKPAFEALKAYATGRGEGVPPPAAPGQSGAAAVPVARPQSTTLSLRVTGARPGSSRPVATGQASGATEGTVMLQLQRRSLGRWVGELRSRAEVESDGSYSLALGRSSGAGRNRMRVQARYLGTEQYPPSRRVARYLGTS